MTDKMNMSFKVRYEDGRVVEAVAKPKDFVALERQYGITFTAAFKDKHNVAMEHLFYLAWSPLHRQGREKRAFDEFLDDVDDVETEEGAAEPDPTQLEDSASSSPG